jgi:hypothetical protein
LQTFLTFPAFFWNPSCFTFSWASFANAQAYHLDIALETVPYSYTSLTEIWWAANYTKSHVVGHWWSPEILYQQFLGTDAELLRASLPLPTQECVDNRMAPGDRCSDDFETSVGDPLGACDEPPHPLQKVIASSLYDLSNDPNKPAGIQSPAYEAVKAYHISDLQIGQIFDFWFKINKDWEYDSREAVCEWVVENYDMFREFVPRTHPRVFQDESEWEALQIATLVLSLVAAVFVLVAIVGTYLRRHERSIGVAQIEFAALLLVGLFMVTFASILFAAPPSDATCIAGVWLFNIGYTLELVPLAVKMAAINRLMAAAQQMRRVKLDRRNLFGVVFALAALVVGYMMAWTIADPFLMAIEYILTDDTTSEDETVVIMSPYCESESDDWRIISFIWQGLLLLSATILAFQTRNLRPDMNETSTLAILIYSHFFFLSLRVATFFLETAVRRSTARWTRSILLSTDIISTVIIYFIPKLLDISFGPTLSRSTMGTVLERASMSMERRTLDIRRSFAINYDDTAIIEGSNINSNHRLGMNSRRSSSRQSVRSVDSTGSIAFLVEQSNKNLDDEDEDEDEDSKQEQQPQDCIDTSPSSSVSGSDTNKDGEQQPEDGQLSRGDESDDSTP